jgi:hypothetical protein
MKTENKSVEETPSYLGKAIKDMTIDELSDALRDSHEKYKNIMADLMDESVRILSGEKTKND